MNSLLQRLFTQTIVLWATPVNNGYNTMTFAAPTEIKGRWEDKLDLIVNNNRETQESKAHLYTLADVQKENWVYLGELTDLTEAQLANPKLIDGAYLVMQIETFVNLKGVTIYKKVSV